MAQNMYAICSCLHCKLLCCCSAHCYAVITVHTWSLCALCRLRGVMRPWFDFWFRCYIHCFLFYIICLPTYTFYLLFLTYLLPVDLCKWRKVIKEVRWPEWVWAGECSFWYRPTRVVPDKRPLNGCCYLLPFFSFDNRPASYSDRMS